MEGTMAANQLAIMSPEGGLSRYLTEIRKFPMLAKDQEFMLAQRWKEHQDPEAAHQLVTSHLRLVAKIAMGYRGDLGHQAQVRGDQLMRGLRVLMLLPALGEHELLVLGQHGELADFGEVAREAAFRRHD